MSQTTIQFDKNDIKLMFDALCYFDMDHDGTDYYTDDLNNSFHYLYHVLNQHFQNDD